mmetsp:Transcript_28700/g.68476  ORF Transcript_28700/g.68476 Transcript_28700/m.68476 type:complete len:200 (-) Transcript_28700:1369-1968(-)
MLSATFTNPEMLAPPWIVTPYSSAAALQLWYISFMMTCSLLSTSSRVHCRRRLFWLISSPLTATPPAFAAFAGANRTLCAWNAWMASGVLGMLAPSATSMHPWTMRASAALWSSSFCVAHGIAMSIPAPETCQGLIPWKNCPVGESFGYSARLMRWTFFSSMICFSMLAVMPSGSYMVPWLSDMVTGTAPSSMSFWTAY